MPIIRPTGRATMIRPLAAAFFALFLALGAGAVVDAGESGIAGLGGGSGMAGLLGEGIDFKGGMLDWEEDDAGRRVAILRNYAVIILPQVTISARNMVLNVELQEIYAEGDVVFDEPAGNSFYCDQLTFNYQEWTGLAKNIRIKMDRADVTLPVVDFLDTAPSTSLEGAGSISSMERTGPIRRMYVQAAELRAHDSETFELIDAKITPDAFARPKWYFRSPAALLRRNEKIESYHNTVNIGRFPALYIPYLIRDLQYDWPWMRMSAGHTGDYGYFVRTQWGWKLNENPDSFFKMDKIIFDLDYFSKRGVGPGIEFDYKVGDWDSIGKFKVYGVYEHAISQEDDRKRFETDGENMIYFPSRKDIFGNDITIDPDLYRKDFRWAVDWEHYQQLNDLWDIRAEAHLYHDRDYLRDYDESRYLSGKEPENWLGLRRLDKNWELEFVAQSRLSNKWETSAEYYPEMRLTVPSLQIGNLPLYFKNDLRVGVVDKYFDEDAVRYTQLRPDGLWGLDEWGLSASRLWNKDHFGAMFRAVNDARIEAPIKVAEAFTVKPWVGLRAAYYGDTLGAPVSDQYLNYSGSDYEARHRVDSNNNPIPVFTPGQMLEKGPGDYQLAAPFGVDLSTRAYTVFGAHDQWRLISEPVLSYLENTKSHLDYNKDIYPVDEWDVYNRQRRFGFELHNRLQRRDYEGADGERIPERNILDFSMRFYYYPREKDRILLNYGDPDRAFTEINFEATYRPVPHLSLSASVDYDIYDSTINRAIFWADWRLSDRFRVYLTQYHYRGDYWRQPGGSQSDQTYLALRTKLWNDSSHYALEGAIGYEWRDSNDWRYNRSGVRRGLNQYRISLFRDLDTFEMSLSYVRNRYDDDQGLYFTLSPKNFMGRDRPPPVYTPTVEELAEGRYPDMRYRSDSSIEAPVVDADLKDVQF